METLQTDEPNVSAIPVRNDIPLFDIVEEEEEDQEGESEQHSEENSVDKEHDAFGFNSGDFSENSLFIPVQGPSRKRFQRIREEMSLHSLTISGNYVDNK